MTFGRECRSNDHDQRSSKNRAGQSEAQDYSDEGRKQQKDSRVFGLPKYRESTGYQGAGPGDVEDPRAMTAAAAVASRQE
jgi:hypothetical protein